MKLSTRRTIRNWLLDLPNGTMIAAGVAAVGTILLGVFSETDAVVLAGFLGFFGVIYLHSMVWSDACPNCRSQVSATSERYCSTCGTRLDELEAAPPIDDRVDERFRPVGLSEIERSPPPEAIADGGEFDEPDESEVNA
ncbi:zinc ribbon domain-containing protein [Halorubrum sp. N11]|uniref:zinc ribbon domain-containing protein n=1 Tax=Halorubrum sp. N11 TaxID=3402276 RepID=UPI003EBDBDBC